MDPIRLAKDDEYKYQFLLLDQPQYLPVSALNKLLEGKRCSRRTRRVI